jgi:hypothetical protein
MEETIMAKLGAVYQPELIELMKTVLDEVASVLPASKQTSTMKVTLASRILAAAAGGVRDPRQLKVAALGGSEGDLYRSYTGAAPQRADRASGGGPTDRASRR